MYVYYIYVLYIYMYVHIIYVYTYLIYMLILWDFVGLFPMSHPPSHLHPTTWPCEAAALLQRQVLLCHLCHLRLQRVGSG